MLWFLVYSPSSEERSCRGETMVANDIVGVLFVYIYVALLLVVTEKVLRRYPAVSRKILHIMVGNVVFILPMFQTREIMAFLAAAPFIFLTFLISPYSPVRGLSKVSKAGHELGLVYYSISWTILAYLFFDQMEIIGVGILAMSYGDGFASLIGARFGRHTYQVFCDKKSIEGSTVMFLVTFGFLVIDLLFYSIPLTIYLFVILVLVSFLATVVEAVTPRGLDNLTVPLVASFAYWYLSMV